jgi:hypothetical protein
MPPSPTHNEKKQHYSPLLLIRLKMSEQHIIDDFILYVNWQNVAGLTWLRPVWILTLHQAPRYAKSGNGP